MYSSRKINKTTDLKAFSGATLPKKVMSIAHFDLRMPKSEKWNTRIGNVFFYAPQMIKKGF